MIAYLDTSALVKLYVEEAGSGDVRGAVSVAQAVATSRVAYPEARAALARRHREGALSEEELRRCAAALDDDLDALVIVELTAPVAMRAGDLAEQRALRGFDGVHLASALELRRLAGERPSFWCYDDRLEAAARLEGLQR